MKIFKAIFLVLLSFCAQAQKDSLVRISCVITEYSYSFGKPNNTGLIVSKILYNENNQIQKQVFYTRDSKILNSFIYTYSANGKLSRKEEYKRNSKIFRTTVYSYNDEGALESEIIYDLRGKMNEKKIYIFGNDKTRWKERTEYDRRGLYARTVTEKFDAEGNREEGTVFDEFNKIKYRFKIIGRDQFGNELQRVLTTPDGKTTQLLTREWDARNRLIKRDYSGKEKVDYSYNEQGYLESEKYFDTDTGEPIKLVKYTYDFKK